jgi:hypothetical protein
MAYHPPYVHNLVAIIVMDLIAMMFWNDFCTTWYWALLYIVLWLTAVPPVCYAVDYLRFRRWRN